MKNNIIKHAPDILIAIMLLSTYNLTHNYNFPDYLWWMPISCLFMYAVVLIIKPHLKNESSDNRKISASP